MKTSERILLILEQHKAMPSLAKRDGLTSVEIAERIGMRRGPVQTALHRLQQQGYVSRSLLVESLGKPNHFPRYVYRRTSLPLPGERRTTHVILPNPTPRVSWLQRSLTRIKSLFRVA